MGRIRGALGKVLEYHFHGRESDSIFGVPFRRTFLRQSYFVVGGCAFGVALVYAVHAVFGATQQRLRRNVKAPGEGEAFRRKGLDSDKKMGAVVHRLRKGKQHLLQDMAVDLGVQF